MDTSAEMTAEYHERAKHYLENALKILGLAQIAGAVAEMFWGGTLELTLFNVLILVTGLIFFFGAEGLKKPLKILLHQEEKEVDRARYESNRTFEPPREWFIEEKHQEEKEKLYKKYNFLGEIEKGEKWT